ncbi:hypothetical protein ACUY1T_21520 [Billgrantia sp. Q4P2]|uniref:hypothetical protein n=1 Tax=Billgrantia sp. Q4P2 TaxID=3463857 RepID=UPI004055B040
MSSPGGLEEALLRWLNRAEPELRLDIDRRCCALGKAYGGIRCVFGVEMSSRDARFSPTLLLRIASVSLERFPGALAINPEDGQCVLVKWIPCAGSATQDCEVLLSLVERMANQADVWCDLCSRHGPHSESRSRAPLANASGLTLSLSLRLSQQLSQQQSLQPSPQRFSPA